MSRASINREISALQTFTRRNMRRFNPRVASATLDTLRTASLANRRGDGETARRALDNARAFVLSCEGEA